MSSSPPQPVFRTRLARNACCNTMSHLAAAGCICLCACVRRCLDANFLTLACGRTAGLIRVSIISICLLFGVGSAVVRNISVHDAWHRERAHAMLHTNLHGTCWMMAPYTIRHVQRVTCDMIPDDFEIRILIWTTTCHSIRLSAFRPMQRVVKADLQLA